MTGTIIAVIVVMKLVSLGAYADLKREKAEIEKTVQVQKMETSK